MSRGNRIPKAEVERAIAIVRAGIATRKTDAEIMIEAGIKAASTLYRYKQIVRERPMPVASAATDVKPEPVTVPVRRIVPQVEPTVDLTRRYEWERKKHLAQLAENVAINQQMFGQDTLPRGVREADRKERLQRKISERLGFDVILEDYR